MKPSSPLVVPELLRKREAAVILSVSERQVDEYVRAGLLTIVRLPNIRAVRLARDQVVRLAQRWIAAAGVEGQQ